MTWLEILLAALAAGLAAMLYRQVREFGKLKRWASQSQRRSSHVPTR